MAVLCTRKQCVAEIEDIVMGASDRIVLVSPYINADEDIVEWLKRKTKDVDVVVIYGKEEHQRGAKNLFEVKGVTKIFVKDLHAKCFLNERKALVTSMNLYEYSQNNNEEIGILVTKEADKEPYEKVINLVEHWEAKGKKLSVMGGLLRSVKAAMEPEPKTPKPTKAVPSLATLMAQGRRASVPKEGYCIRCHDSVEIDASDLKPYCLSCYGKRRRSKVGDKYKENFCLFCGESEKTTLKKPACLTCYYRYEEVVKFEAASARSEKEKRKW